MYLSKLLFLVGTNDGDKNLVAWNVGTILVVVGMLTHSEMLKVGATRYHGWREGNQEGQGAVRIRLKLTLYLESLTYV